VTDAYKENFKAIDWSVPIPEVPRERHRGPRSSAVACPYFITDNVGEVVGQHDGKVYDSKSALRASYKAMGMVEIGNDPIPPTEAKKPPVTRDDVAEAVSMVKQGYKPELGTIHEDLD
jgi:hypothetical protein